MTLALVVVLLALDSKVRPTTGINPIKSRWLSQAQLSRQQEKDHPPQKVLLLRLLVGQIAESQLARICAKAPFEIRDYPLDAAQIDITLGKGGNPFKAISSGWCCFERSVAG